MAIEFKDGKYVDPQTGRVTLDPTVYKDWQIAEEAEKNLPSVDYFREKLGLLPEEIIPYGKTPKIDFIKVMKRLKDKPDGKFIEVTAITPTPFGEGKSTVSLGLIEGLGKLGLNVGGALRQPSGGPTMNVKGTAAGGGNALLMPMTEFSLGLTGDINDIMNAHNLAMTALNARMQHERNYDDETLAKRGLRRLDIDPERCRLLLSNMRGATNRAAHFHTAIVCAFPNGDTLTAERDCAGTIAFAPMGDGGFGYDPVFFVPSLRKTFAQLTAEEKNAISHRGSALRAFAAELKTYLEKQ